MVESRQNSSVRLRLCVQFLILVLTRLTLVVSVRASAAMCTQLGTHFVRCTQRTVPRAQRCGPVLHVVSAPVTESELGGYAVVCQEAAHAAYLVRASLSSCTIPR